jgi:hypothetical protein
VQVGVVNMHSALHVRMGQQQQPAEQHAGLSWAYPQPLFCSSIVSVQCMCGCMFFRLAFVHNQSHNECAVSQEVALVAKQGGSKGSKLSYILGCSGQLHSF